MAKRARRPPPAAASASSPAPPPPPASTGPSLPATRGPGFNLDLAMLLVVLLVLDRLAAHQIVGDDIARFRALSSLLGEPTQPFENRYSLVGPLFAAPL